MSCALLSGHAPKRYFLRLLLSCAGFSNHSPMQSIANLMSSVLKKLSLAGSSGVRSKRVQALMAVEPLGYAA